MIISDVAEIRTGLVMARKKALTGMKYRTLNLKCIADQGFIRKEAIDIIHFSEELKNDYLTQMGDILVRLSFPYTAVLINSKELCGIVIPSHFAIIRVDKRIAVPEYIYWSLRREKNKIRLIQNSSGSTLLGTVSSNMIANLPIRMIPIENQKSVGCLMLLSEREQELLHLLADEKKKYNSLMLDGIYKSMKRGYSK